MGTRYARSSSHQPLAWSLQANRDTTTVRRPLRQSQRLSPRHWRYWAQVSLWWDGDVFDGTITEPLRMTRSARRDDSPLLRLLVVHVLHAEICQPRPPSVDVQ